MLSISYHVYTYFKVRLVGYNKDMHDVTTYN
jgi:hypothetical protein